MYAIYLHILGMVHDFKWIAETINRWFLTYELNIPLKKGGNEIVFFT
jgi:hypothetical protein